MNKKGNLFMLGLMFAVFVFIGSTILLEPIRESTENVRTDLSCGTPGISMYVEMTCIAVGSMLPIFALSAIATALAVIGIKKIAFPEQ
jgi:hypothetical protein